MALLPGSSRAIVSQNIRTLCEETRCSDMTQHRRNVAIVLSAARTYFNAHGSGPVPAHLQHPTKKK